MDVGAFTDCSSLALFIHSQAKALPTLKTKATVANTAVIFIALSYMWFQLLAVYRVISNADNPILTQQYLILTTMTVLELFT